MEHLDATLMYAPLFGLMYAVLTLIVVILRLRHDIPYGDAGNDLLMHAVRAHGNFIEYVPLILILSALLESTGYQGIPVHGMLGFLLLARFSHATAMFLYTGSGMYRLTRVFGALTTWIVLVLVSVLLLGQVFG